MHNILPQKHKKKFQKQITVYCEGSQEEEYFAHLKKLINNHTQNKKVLNLTINNCRGGGPKVPVKTAIKHSNQSKEILVVFDYDNKKTEFEEAIDLARKNKIKFGYSNINFDYWLVLHKLKSENISYGEKQGTNAYEMQLKNIYGLKKDDDIKNQQIIKKIVNQITFDDVLNAIHCCEKIKEKNSSTRKPIFTKSNYEYYNNPDIQVHEPVKRIIHECTTQS